MRQGVEVHTCGKDPPPRLQMCASAHVRISTSADAHMWNVAPYRRTHADCAKCPRTDVWSRHSSTCPDAHISTCTDVYTRRCEMYTSARGKASRFTPVAKTHLHVSRCAHLRMCRPPHLQTHTYGMWSRTDVHMRKVQDAHARASGKHTAAHVEKTQPPSGKSAESGQKKKI